MKNVFKSKLMLLVTGLLIVAVVAVPLILNSVNSLPAHAATVPSGFTKTQLASGLTNPTEIAFAPTGDIFIGEQAGTILIYRNGAILPTPLGTINTDGSNERGLLGLAVDPNYATNGYIYVSYTTLDEHAQLSRFTVQNDAINLSSEVVFMKGNQLQSPHHSANDLHIGPDGKLWWAVGDNSPSISNGPRIAQRDVTGSTSA